LVHLKKNVGVSAARNQGIELTKGDFIAFCDADDLCQPQRLERQLEFLEQHPDIALCGSAFTCFDTQDREIVVNPVSDAEIRNTLMLRSCFGLSTIMARAAIFKSVRFDETLSVAEDYELWTRLAASGVRFANLPESLLRYRWHPQQASRHKGERLDVATRRIRGEYCISLLGDVKLIARLGSGSIGIDDLEAVAQRIARHTSHEPRAFRFMLAWLYQQLPRHGLIPWWRWTRIQKRLRLELDRNYRFNTAILAFLPVSVGRKYFDTLIKLKR
jgi:glycosyltransferase involved in cell wall biosynthesis